MDILFGMLAAFVDVFWWLIIISVVLSWLVAFDVINLHNHFVYNLYSTLNAFVEPLLRPIRRLLPDLGGIDLSPIFLLIMLSTLSYFLRYKMPQLLAG